MSGAMNAKTGSSRINPIPAPPTSMARLTALPTFQRSVFARPPRNASQSTSALIGMTRSGTEGGWDGGRSRA